jgi:hypothetical protein
MRHENIISSLPVFDFQFKLKSEGLLLISNSCVNPDLSTSAF